MSERQNSSLSVFFSSLKMAIATMLSRLFGLVREQVMAATFGASGFTDAFLVAYRIPNLLRDLLAEGAFSAAFVPSFVAAKKRSQAEARSLLWSLFLLLAGLTLAIGALIIFFAPQLIALFAPSFKASPEKFALTVKLTQLMAPYLMLVSLAALMMGVLNAVKMFFIPATAPLFFNIAMIISMLILPSFLHANDVSAVYSLAIGVILGGFLQLLVQLPFVLKKGFAPKKVKKLWSPEVRLIMLKLGPGLVGFAATQINLLVNTILATGTMVGAVSWLNYAFRLFQLPVGILGVSVGNSNLVHFSDKWKSGDLIGARDILASSYHLSLFLVMPAMSIAYFFSVPIVELLFQRGQFSVLDTEMTALTLRFYILGLPFYAIYKILVPTFYAIDKQRIPVTCSVLAIILNIVFCVALTPLYGFKVLALGTSLSMLVNVMAQGYFIGKFLKINWRFFVTKRFAKINLGTFISGALCWYLAEIFLTLELSFVHKVFALTLSFLLVIVCYGACFVLMGETEMLQKLRRKEKNRTR